jgi:dihydrofolate reductase
VPVSPVSSLRARLIDELHITISPVLLGKGEALFADIDLASLGYRCANQVGTENATHVIIRRA